MHLSSDFLEFLLNVIISNKNAVYFTKKLALAQDILHAIGVVDGMESAIISRLVLIIKS